MFKDISARRAQTRGMPESGSRSPVESYPPNLTPYGQASFMSHSPSEDGPGNWPTPNRAGSGGGGRHPTGGGGSGNGGADNEGGSGKSQPGVPPYQAPQTEPVVERFDPHLVWRKVLSDLAIQMPAGSYDTWVRDTWVMGFEDGEFIIGLPNAYARDWLENRLRA